MQKKVSLIVAVLLTFVAVAMPVFAHEDHEKRGCSHVNVDLTGTWIMKSTYIHDCEGYPDTLPPFPVEIVQTGNKVTVSSAIYNFTTTICGDTIKWSGSYPDSGGTTFVDYFWMKVSADGKSMTGQDAWHWTIGDYTVPARTGQSERNNRRTTMIIR